MLKNEKLTNEIVDVRLINRNIKRVGNYINSRTKINFKCLIINCDFEWMTTPHHILNGKRGCPKCGGTVKLTIEIITNRLKERNIKVIGLYKNCDIKTDFQCLVCSNIWAATPNNILNGEKGCPKCSSGKNEKLIWKILKNNGINFVYHEDIRKIINGENRRIYVDFYFPDLNSIIEYNGEQHYNLVCFGSMDKTQSEKRFLMQQERDQYLQQFCNENGIQLIWIDGRKYTNSKLKTHLIEIVIPQFLTKFIA